MRNCLLPEAVLPPCLEGKTYISMLNPGTGRGVNDDDNDECVQQPGGDMVIMDALKN
jgi:hypothetical protein